MNKLRSLLHKELQFYLNSPVAYGIAILYLVFTTFWFFKISLFMVKDSATMRDYFAVLPRMFAFLLPAITMRSWSEERRTGTQELLLTMPFSQWQLVLSKFLAPLILVVGILVLSIPLPLSIMGLGNFDFGVIISQYLGSVLVASTALSLGTFISSLSRNQVMAFLGTMAVLVFLTWIDYFTKTTAMTGLFPQILTYLSLNNHFDSFAKGLIDSRDVLFFVVTTYLFLFLNERRLVLGKWS